MGDDSDDGGHQELGTGRDAARSGTTRTGDAREFDEVHEALHHHGQVPQQRGCVSVRCGMVVDSGGAGAGQGHGGPITGTQVEGDKQESAAEMGLVFAGALGLVEASADDKTTGGADARGRQGTVTDVVEAGGSMLGQRYEQANTEGEQEDYHTSVVVTEDEWISGSRGLCQVPTDGGSVDDVGRGGGQCGDNTQSRLVATGQGTGTDDGGGGGAGHTAGGQSGLGPWVRRSGAGAPGEGSGNRPICQTGSGRCEHKCKVGQWGGSGRWVHKYKIAQGSTQAKGGKGRKANKNMMPQALHEELLKAAGIR